MRNKINFNSDWLFSKDNINFEPITIPHTWNNIDGTDGGSNYYRGLCYYKKNFVYDKTDKLVFLEINAASQSAVVYLNGFEIGKHDGGYSTFRIELTEFLKHDNELIITVTNEVSDSVYPQQADFTFYGGIYRDVFLIEVPKTHFSLSYYGGPGLKITSKIVSNVAYVEAVAFISNGEKKKVTFKTDNKEITTVVNDNIATAIFEIQNPHLWSGLEDPFLYNMMVSIDDDMISQDYGIREFRMDPNEGFILNNKKYLLRGVARHQDKETKGVAISKEDMEEDLKIILDIGATAIRLAHYQHDQYFYDLCDKAGVIVWAEIPYISEHLANGNQNTRDQLSELIIQNYNHPSIICWGLSNEICISNDINEARYQNHVELNNLAHYLDSTRPTAMAHIGAFNFDTNKLFNVPDIHGSNIYYGWYEKNVEDVRDYFDSRHKAHPNACLSISEYGADCNPKYASLNGERGDYTENYQCFYHENMLKIIEERPYLWASFVWNMFDFGADSRNEGGKPGQNQKGLVTFDRKYKKDAYYMYKAHWNKEPMIHICNKAYLNRTEENTKIVVYSNLDTLSLYIDGLHVETKSGMFKYEFEFHIYKTHLVEIRGENNLIDSCVINKVSEPDKSYVLDNKAIINWLGFIDKEKDGYFTLNSRVEEILANKEAREYTLTMLKDYGITLEYLTSDNPRNPGTTFKLIPIKFVLRMCKTLTPGAFNDFALGLMNIKK